MDLALAGHTHGGQCSGHSIGPLAPAGTQQERDVQGQPCPTAEVDWTDREGDQSGSAQAGAGRACHGGPTRRAKPYHNDQPLFHRGSSNAGRSAKSSQLMRSSLTNTQPAALGASVDLPGIQHLQKARQQTLLSALAAWSDMTLATLVPSAVDLHTGSRFSRRSAGQIVASGTGDGAYGTLRATATYANNSDDLPSPRHTNAPASASTSGSPRSLGPSKLSPASASPWGDALPQNNANQTTNRQRHEKHDKYRQ